jgi:hypothetical protein
LINAKVVGISFVTAAVVVFAASRIYTSVRTNLAPQEQPAVKIAGPTEPLALKDVARGVNSSFHGIHDVFKGRTKEELEKVLGSPASITDFQHGRPRLDKLWTYTDIKGVSGTVQIIFSKNGVVQGTRLGNGAWLFGEYDHPAKIGTKFRGS